MDRQVAFRAVRDKKLWIERRDLDALIDRSKETFGSEGEIQTEIFTQNRDHPGVNIARPIPKSGSLASAIPAPIVANLQVLYGGVPVISNVNGRRCIRIRGNSVQIACLSFYADCYLS